jgi:hypothetical protein
MGAYTTMNDLHRGLDEQVAEDFYWYLLHSTAAHAFPEGVYYQDRTAWGETIPHLPRSRPLAGKLKGLKVIYRPDQKKRWDFETVVRLYNEKAAPRFKE